MRETIPEKSSRDTVVLILSSLKLDNKVPNGHGGFYVTSQHLLHYYDDYLIRHNVAKSSDTIHEIATRRSHLEVLLTYKGIDKLSFIFQNGDSILIESVGNELHLKMLNRKVKRHDLDYELLNRDVLLKGAYPTTAKSILPAPFIYEPNASLENGVKLPLSHTEFQTRLQGYWRNLFDDHQEEKMREKSFLDSLYAKDQLSDDVYQFYKQKNQSSDNELLFFEPDSVPDTFGDDSLIFFSFFRNYVTKLTNRKWSNPIVAQKNGYAVDRRRQYDSIRVTASVTPKTRDFLLTQALEEILSGFRSKYSAEYFTKYQADIKDDKLVSYIAEKYKINRLTYLDEPLLLEDPFGRLHSFDSIIAQNHSKVIYLDFWASWCGPCLKEIPSLNRLQQWFARRNDVVLIYVSRDEDRSAWLKSIKENKITDNSFLITNLYSARFLSEINFEEIPRYLLYDGKGTIVEQFAPPPSQLIESGVLEKYLE